MTDQGALGACTSTRTTVEPAELLEATDLNI